MSDEIASSTETIARYLKQVRGSGRFAARRTAPADDLSIEVDGVGPLRFPLSSKQARALVAVGRPASFGLGEETILDLRVRNSTEIPKSRVRIDGRRFRSTLDSMLEGLREDLGLSELRGSRRGFRACCSTVLGSFSTVTGTPSGTIPWWPVWWSPCPRPSRAVRFS